MRGTISMALGMVLCIMLLCRCAPIPYAYGCLGQAIRYYEPGNQIWVGNTYLGKTASSPRHAETMELLEDGEWWAVDRHNGINMDLPVEVWTIEKAKRVYNGYYGG